MRRSCFCVVAVVCWDGAPESLVADLSHTVLCALYCDYLQWTYGVRGGFQPSNYDIADAYFTAKFMLKVCVLALSYRRIVLC